MIKLVALDLDGTLLEPSGLISQPTLEQLKRINDQGVKIAIATGRPSPVRLTRCEKIVCIQAELILSY